MRLLPERPFPAYAYLPGRDPHPTRDAAGHSFGQDESDAPYLPASRWRANRAYLWGADLYDHGYLWEAHEAWEGIWHASKHDVRQALHLQGLIQCAAAALKVPMGQPKGLERLAALGTEKLEQVARETGGDYMGVALFDFIPAMRAFAESRPTTADARPRLDLVLADQ